ncbi:MAG: MBL fold metallo-hydrolase [Kiritimatiellales bacterium]
MNTEIIPTGTFDENCAVISNGREALILDPGYDADQIETILRKNGLTVAAYLCTHGHADHLNALAALHKNHPAPVYIHADDHRWAFSPQNQIPPYYPVPEKPDADFIHPETSNAWKIGGLDFQCLETPGHTPGGVCYYFEKEKVLFAGDTLFKGSCGRTDLPGGDARTLSRSLKKLAVLPDDITVYSGHGDATTIGHEKLTNFYMQQAAR